MIFDRSDETTIEEAVGQAIGAASTCWERLENTGVFDSERAYDISEELLDFLRGKMILPR